MAAWFRWQSSALVLDVRIQPRASVSEVVGPRAARLKVRISAPPVDNAANRQLQQLMAKQFGVAKSSVRIVSGATSRDKRLAIEAPARIPDWLSED